MWQTCFESASVGQILQQGPYVICAFCSTYLRSFDHRPRKLAQVDSADAIIVAGDSSSSTFDGLTNAGGKDVMMIKFTSAGAHQWTVLHGGSGDDYAVSLRQGGRVLLMGIRGDKSLCGRRAKQIIMSSIVLGCD